LTWWRACRPLRSMPLRCRLAAIDRTCCGDHARPLRAGLWARCGRHGCRLPYRRTLALLGSLTPRARARGLRWSASLPIDGQPAASSPISAMAAMSVTVTTCRRGVSPSPSTGASHVCGAGTAVWPTPYRLAGHGHGMGSRQSASSSDVRCGHHCACVPGQRGHTVRLMPPGHAKSPVKHGRTDAADHALRGGEDHTRAGRGC
jgi:hypothetical protein